MVEKERDSEKGAKNDNNHLELNLIKAFFYHSAHVAA